VTVRELIGRLERMNPSARVLVVINPRWAWEHEVAAVVERKSLDEDDRDEHWENDDVLLLEGPRVGFGPEFAWVDAAKREVVGG
jgi:hypothetical protein